MYRIIDWMPALPGEAASLYLEMVSRYEEEHRVRHIAWIEQYGYEQGMKEGIQHGLQQGLEQGLQRGTPGASCERILDIREVRFGRVSPWTAERLQRIKDSAVLKTLAWKEAVVASPAVVETETSRRTEQ